MSCELSNNVSFEEITRQKVSENIDKMLETNFSREILKENFNKTLTEKMEKKLDINVSEEMFKEAVNAAGNFIFVANT